MPEAENSACFLGLLFFIAPVPILAQAQGCFCVGVGVNRFRVPAPTGVIAHTHRLIVASAARRAPVCNWVRVCAAMSVTGLPVLCRIPIARETRAIVAMCASAVLLELPVVATSAQSRGRIRGSPDQQRTTRSIARPSLKMSCLFPIAVRDATGLSTHRTERM